MADKSPGVVGKSQAVLTTQSAVASLHPNSASTPNLCMKANSSTPFVLSVAVQRRSRRTTSSRTVLR
jgi:hypothetical protein